MTRTALERLEELGVWSPARPEAAERRALLEHLFEAGATVEDVAAATRAGRLESLGVEIALGGSDRLTLGEVAARAGAAVDDALRLWRAWGFPAPQRDDRRFTEHDVAMLRFALSIEGLIGREDAFHTARVMGTAMGRVVEAETAMIRGAVEAPMQRAGADVVALVHAYEQLVATMLGPVEETLAALHRHHLVEVARRAANTGLAGADGVVDVVVGFADLSGSTRLATDLTLDDLDRAIARFEERCADLVADAGASLVKRIGDAALFTTSSATTAASLAQALVDEFVAHPAVPPVRVGLAAGRVVARRGDVYGLPVVLAARLLGVARPSTVLADAAVCNRLPHTVRVEPRGRHSLAGFAAPVPVFRILARGDE